MSSAHTRFALQAFGDVAVDDALRQAFDDRGLAGAGLADQHGIVLRAAREHWMTRRISSSRPITGSSLPCSAASVRSRPNFESA